MSKTKYTDASDKLWAQHFSETICNRENKPTGEGWRTLKQLRAMLNCSDTTANRYIRKAKQSGSIDYFNGTQIINGKLCKQVWYRPKPRKA
jgi:hypothetical protein